MIYAIQAGKKGPIKFGMAKDPKQRMAALQVSHHQKLRLLGAQDARDDALVERQIHERCRAYRIRGEWFSPSKPVSAVALKIMLGTVEEHLRETAEAPVPATYAKYTGKAFDVIKHFLKKHAGYFERLPYG